ncbi:YIP1 family protein [Steroidobacter sp.]|uniref:YIP1 family protein n=1 Tax=Steroidobacter sp. TaxID=1978227 RepID=UPI001A4D73A5|nr:YIP1 family protein [Steroidobacter sp.]MBL8265029.1 YIP1 family protein [Steroidobacter sp.]
MKNTELAWAILTSPGSAFIELQERPRFWFPLLATVFGAVALIAWYYSIVDLRWLMEQILSVGGAAQMPEEQRAQAVAATSRGFMLGSSVVGGAVAIVAFKLLEAVYYSLAGKITNVEKSFRHWLTLAAWTGLPSLLGVLASAAVLLAADTNQLGTGELAVLSLNELFFHTPLGGKGNTLLSALTLLHPWMWGLSVLGVRVWTGRSWAFSAIFALLPVVVGYGIWAAISFS